METFLLRKEEEGRGTFLLFLFFKDPVGEGELVVERAVEPPEALSDC